MSEAELPPDGHTHELSCLNCTTPLRGPFCFECGQAAHVHRTLVAFFHDLLHGAFHFEGRIWHTLPLLVTQPGALTRRYIDGQRARFVSPLALFLFCVFVLFATIQQMADTTPHVKHSSAAVEAKQLQSAEAQLANLQARRATEHAHNADTSDTDAGIVTLQTVVATLKRGETAAAPKPTGTGISIGASTGWPFIDRGIDSIRENPGLVIYKIEMHAYKYSWLLIPISVPFVWLLFPFDRRFPVYDHTVFVTYSLSFMTLLSVIVLIVSNLGLDAIIWLLVVIPPIHMYHQLRGAYHCSRAGAALRTMGLVVAAGVAFVIFAAVILAQSTD